MSQEIFRNNQKVERVENYEELREIYEQWRKDWPEVEEKINQIVERSGYSAGEKIREGLRVSLFAVDLVKSVFGSVCERVSDFEICLRPNYDGAAFLVGKDRSMLIVMGSDFLKKRPGWLRRDGFTLEAEAFASLVGALTEEISHWVYESLAWARQPEKKAKEIEEYIIKRDEKNLARAELVRLGMAAIANYRQARNAYHATPMEFMGIVWQRQVGKVFLSWSQFYEGNEADYQVILSLKRERARASS